MMNEECANVIFHPQMTRMTRISQGGFAQILVIGRKKHKICVIRVICG